MKNRKKIIGIFCIIILIFTTLSFIFNNRSNNASKTQISGKIEYFYGSNEKIVGEMTLSTEKTQEAMENNSKVLQNAMDEVSNSGGGTIRLPAGTYYFAPTGEYIELLESGATEKKAYYVVECRDNVKIVGAGVDESSINRCTILKPYGYNLDVSLTMFQYISKGEVRVCVENADFENFIIDSNETTKDPDSGFPYVAQGKGFSFSAFKDCDWNNVVVKNTDGTGFGMDLPINATVTNCVAIGCGKAATENDVGASGFGIGTGYFDNESMKISNCLAIGNRKFGFFFEHQGRFVSYIDASSAKGFIVTNCVARGNMHNFGGEKANDVVYINCMSENSLSSDPNPLGNKNTKALYFGTNTRRVYLENCNVEQVYSDVPSGNEYYDYIYWGANNAILDSGLSVETSNAFNESTKAEAVAMLWRFAGWPGDVLKFGEQVNTGYSDVLPTEWFADALAWAYKEGIVDGGESFNPALSCIRADFITMLWRYAGKPIVTTGNNFTDVNDGDYFENAVNWALNKGIIENTGEEFSPASAYTKAEILKILYKYDEINPQRTVVYDYWENGGYDSEKVYELKHKNESIDLSVEAQKEGYDFIGWSTNKDATNKIYSLNMSSKNIYLYALYRKNIEISFDANEGYNTPNSQTATLYNNDENVSVRLTSSIPTREGYIFKGWTDEKTSSEVKYQPGQAYSFDNDCTLYAVWEKSESSLTIRPNGGTWNNTTENTIINGVLGTTINIENPVSPKGVTITFDGNGGTPEKTSDTSTKTFDRWVLEGSGSLSGTIYTFGEGQGTLTANYINNGINMPTATRDGYSFKGWTDEKDSTQVKYSLGQTYTFNNDCILYAVWGTKGKFVVTYNYTYNGGESSEKSAEELDSGSSVDLSVNAKKTGYEFVGWSTNPNAKEGLESLNIEDQDIILYAIFKKDINLVFVDYNGTQENRTEKNITIYNNEKGEIVAPTINKYLDWNSRYWTTEEEPDSNGIVNEEEKIVNILNNQTFYARYTKEIKIDFDLNGGNGTVPETVTGNIEVNSSNINKIKEIEITIPNAEIYKEGYSFSGWNTSKDGSGTDYKVDNKSTFSSNTILYAKWTKQGESGEADTLPTLEIEYEPKDNWTNQNIELVISARDEDYGIERVTVNGKVVLENDGETKYIISENGTYEIIAIDKAGNSTKKSITISNIDKTLPVIEKIEVSGDEINITSIDNESGTKIIEYSYDGNTWNDLLDESIDKEFTISKYDYKTGESYIILKDIYENNKTMYFRSIDEAGNISEVKNVTLNSEEENQNDNENTTSNNTNISNTEKEENNSDSLANKWLPYAGRNTIIILIIIISIMAIIFKKKYNDLKDIK